MGYGDDWKAAMEKVKQDHLAPGSQPGLVRDLALEAIQFVKDRDLVTIPPLDADFWRIEMMGPAQQKVAPFFLGGPDIQVAFPTDAMDYEDKLQSLRANNVHFARATVFARTGPRASPPVLLRDSRVNTGTSCAVHDAVLGRGLGPLVGVPILGPRVAQDCGGQDGDALLAVAPLRPDHLLPEFPHGQMDARSNASTSWSTAWATSAQAQRER